MRLLVLGGTRFLGRHVAAAALERGHDVATFTRGVSGEPPEGGRALHGDRDDLAALPKALDGWEQPELMVDTSCQTRAAAATTPPAPLGGVPRLRLRQQSQRHAAWARRGSFSGARRTAPPGTARWLGDRFLTARAGLIIGPYDPIYRLGWAVDSLARGGRVVVPDALDQPIAVVDARGPGRLAGGDGRAAASPAGSTPPDQPGWRRTADGPDLCREATLAATPSGCRCPRPSCSPTPACSRGSHLPLWLPADDRRHCAGTSTRPAPWELGLPSRPLRDSVAHTWAWQRASGASGRATGPPAPRPPPRGWRTGSRSRPGEGPAPDGQPRSEYTTPPTCW